MDYDKLTTVWTEKDKNSVHMDNTALKAKIDEFINAHNTGALAVGSGDFVRCTPIEYNYFDDYIYLFSEGGMKFKALKDNKNVSFAIFEQFGGFQYTKGLQITGHAVIIEPFCGEYNKVLEYKGFSVEAMKKLPTQLTLIKIIPECFDLLDSDLKKDGFGNRQHLDV